MNWCNTIDPYLAEIGFEPLKSDTCVYICTAKRGEIITLSLNIDDVYLLGGDTTPAPQLASRPDFRH